MGFLVGYTQLFVLKFSIYTILILIDVIKECIFSMFNFLALFHSIEAEASSVFEENSIPTFSEPSLSAILIRELLPPNKFSDLRHHTNGGSNGQEQEQQQECAVCLYEFEGDQEIRCLKNCQHFFHSECIDGWINHDRRTCPLCRKSLVPVHLQDEYNHRLWAASCADYHLHGEDYEVPIF